MRAPVQRLVLAMVFVASSGLAPVFAQQEAVVPTDLVLTLLPSGSPESRLSVGSAPEGLAEALALPADAEVLGSLVTGDNGTVVVVAPGNARDAMRTYSATLDSLGWERPADLGSVRGGFVSTNSRQLAGRCSDAHFVTMRSIQLRDRGYVRIAYRPVEDTACNPNTRARYRLMAMEDDPLPQLTPPPETTVRPASGGGGGEERHLTAYLDTGLTAEEVLAHYTAQLVEAGWAAGDPAHSAGVSAQPFRFQDDDGQEWVGGLTLWRIDETRMKAMLEAALADSRRWG